MDKTILIWLSLFPVAAFLMWYGHYAVFHTDKLLQYYEDKSSVKPGSLVYRMRLSKSKQIFWVKIVGASMMLVGPALIVLLVWASIYDR
ncbi:MAG: hypothetical protein JST49_04335 [Bacteroidetes bacterium]|nr:hypothetical protein [Bacteroidota bacterium]